MAYSRLVNDFPQSKRRADALYALGFAEEEAGNTKQAAGAYDAYLREFADRPLASEVRLRIAEITLKDGDIASAAGMFRELARQPGFSSADYAQRQHAFCLAKLGKFAEAGEAYARLVGEFAQSPYADEATLLAGRSFFSAEKYDEAEQWLKKAARIAGDQAAEAAHWLCRLMIKSGRAAEAAGVAAKCLAAGASGPFAVNLELDEADALHEVPDQRPKALDLYVKFANNHPQHDLASQALYNAAFAALELKRYDAGIKHARSFLQAFPQNDLDADVKYVAAECSLQLKQYEQAQKLYGELVRDHASHKDADAWRVRQGLSAYLQKDYDASIRVLSSVEGQLQTPDSKSEAWFLIGASQFFSDRFGPAQRSLAASLASNPQWRRADEALLLLARAEAKSGETAKAKSSFERLTTSYSSSSFLDEAHYRLGELADAAEDFPTAIKQYEVVATKFPSSQFAPYALYAKGWAELKRKSFLKGVESFTALLSSFPDHALAADARFGRAICRRQSGDAKRAIEDVDAYLKSNPDRTHKSDALYERGLAQVAMKDFSGAVTTLDRLAGDDPQYAAGDKVLYETAWALKSQDKSDDAVRYFAKLAERHPTSPLAAESWFHVGEDLYEQKQYDKAAQAYASAKARQPGAELAEKATYKLGWASYQLQKYDDALAHFSEQIAAFPQGPLSADAVFMKAECLFKLQKFKDAWPAYQAALKTKASTPTIQSLTLLHAGQSAAQLKQWEESARVLGQLAAKHPDSPLIAEATYELGFAQQNLGETDKALASYETAATKSRDHVGARARFMRGELLFGQKKHEEASREFQRAMYGYGGDQATAETKKWQARSGYEAGRCAEVQISQASDATAKLKHIGDATRFYGFVAEKHPDHELAAEAKKRLLVLNKL